MVTVASDANPLPLIKVTVSSVVVALPFTKRTNSPFECTTAVVPPCPRVTVSVLEDIPPTSINSPATLITSEVDMPVALATSIPVSDASSSSASVVVNSSVSIPFHTPAPQPVPKKFVSRPVFIWYLPTTELPPLPESELFADTLTAMV